MRRYLRRRGIAARMAGMGRDLSSCWASIAGSSNGPWSGCSYKRLAPRYDRTALARLAVTLIRARRLPTS